MSKILPQPGDHYARRTKPVVIVETEAGALGLEIAFELIGGDMKYQGVDTFYFGKKDGSLMLSTWESMKEIFPDWAGTNPFELEEIPVNETGEAEFILAQCYIDDSWTPEGKDEPVEQFKAKFLNSLTRGAKRSEPIAESDRKAILAKWGSKFKAVGAASSKSASASKPAAGKTTAPAKPGAPAQGGKPSREPDPEPETETVEESDQETVWDAFQAANPNLDEKKMGAKWFAAQDELFGKGKEAESGEDWGKLKAHLGL
jgi:hypothetical protein